MESKQLIKSGLVTEEQKFDLEFALSFGYRALPDLIDKSYHKCEDINGDDNVQDGQLYSEEDGTEILSWVISKDGKFIINDYLSKEKFSVICDGSEIAYKVMEKIVIFMEYFNY